MQLKTVEMEVRRNRGTPISSYLYVQANGIKIQKAEQVKGLKRTSQMFNVNQCDVSTRPRPSEGDMQSDEED